MCQPRQEELQHRPVEEVLHVEEHQEEHHQPIAAPIQQVVQQEDQTLRQDQRLNEVLVAQIQQQLPAAHAAHAAPGAPIQEQAPARLSFKQRQAEKRHAKEARKHCPVGDAVTYEMHRQLVDLKAQKDNTMEHHQHITHNQEVDMRVLRVFSHGYRTDRKGRPATPQDAAHQQADDQFFADYCSRDITRRRPHLERIVDEMVNLRMGPDQFSERNLRNNMAYLKSMADRMVYLENVMNDPINQPYFDTLDPARRETLDRAFQTVYRPFVAAFSMECQRRGIDFNGARYYGYDEMTPIQMGQEMAGPMIAQYQTALGQYEELREDVRARQEARVQAAAIDFATRRLNGNRALQRVRMDPRFHLRDGERNSPFLTRADTMIHLEEGHEDENLVIVNTLLEIGRLQNGLPTPQLYQQARALLQPRVQRVLDCDVDALLALSDQSLLLESPRLNELFLDNMFVADLMKLNHPFQQDKEHKALTLKDDLVGQRGLEYSYKCSMLRGLAERARGLAILERCKTAQPDEHYFTILERNRNAQADPIAFANGRIEVGNRGIESAITYYRNQLTPGTPQFAQFIEQLGQRGVINSQVIPAKFDAVSREFLDRTTPEAAAAMQRIQEVRYRTLAYTPEQLREMGMPENIGEPVFRSLTSFQRTQAAQTLLSPEEYRQMLLNLGAGSGMEPGVTPDETLRPALEQNAAGLATLREVTRAQYDMLNRKYGTGLEHMTVRDVLEHYGELSNDFANGQVDMNMATKFPGFLREDSPEDQLLKRRILYFAIMGKAACDTITFLRSGQITSDQGIAELIAMGGIQEDCAASRAYLLEHSPGIQHPLDWTQKVRAPEE